MSDTPRTDAEFAKLSIDARAFEVHDFARQLERELESWRTQAHLAQAGHDRAESAIADLTSDEWWADALQAGSITGGRLCAKIVRKRLKDGGKQT